MIMTKNEVQLECLRIAANTENPVFDRDLQIHFMKTAKIRTLDLISNLRKEGMMTF
jgi:hypothetical protein